MSNQTELGKRIIESALLNLLGSEKSILNSYDTIIANGDTWTGTAELNNKNCCMVVVETSNTGTYTIQLSQDGVSFVTVGNYNYNADGSDRPHIFAKGNRHFKVSFSNTSGGAQSYFRLSTYYFNEDIKLNSPLNSIVNRQADTTIVRPLDFNLMVAEGLYQNTSNTIKDGINPDVRSGSVPEDIWYSGGTYTGFPTGAVEAAEIVVAGADTGTVYYSYLASNTSTDYVFGTKAITGAGTYALGHNIWRCNFAYFVASSSTAFNVGDITIRNTPTTANVFTTIPAGFSQSYTAAYTVPFGSAIYIDRVTAVVRGATSTSLDGHFWYRANGESPRLRFPFNVQFGSLYFDDVDYLIRIPALTDIMPRIIASTSASAAEIEISYRFLKIKS